MFHFSTLGGPLIVSCQAAEGSPLRDPGIMAAIADAAVHGGACAIRANGPADVAAIKARVAVPVIGLYKVLDDTGAQWITPASSLARALADAGADAIAIDATMRPRPYPESLEDLIARIRDEIGVAVLADVDTAEAGRRADRAGADAVASTLSGYTDATRGTMRASGAFGPDLALVADLAREVAVPVVAEGRYRTAAQVAQALAEGASAVVMGSALTDPLRSTRLILAELEALVS